MPQKYLYKKRIFWIVLTQIAENRWMIPFQLFGVYQASNQECNWAFRHGLKGPAVPPVLPAPAAPPAAAAAAPAAETKVPEGCFGSQNMESVVRTEVNTKHLLRNKPAQEV